ncbi:hypothetical protein [Kiloniella laminariae]|uniref:hypothetical protein n=1 Tax=Kiloniella laminariae TaxID=454162 RepID=UPI0003722119|nr:hypothetical protein [Kiloniella laminariae]
MQPEKVVSQKVQNSVVKVCLSLASLSVTLNESAAEALRIRSGDAVRVCYSQPDKTLQLFIDPCGPFFVSDVGPKGGKRILLRVPKFMRKGTFRASPVNHSIQPDYQDQGRRSLRIVLPSGLVDLIEKREAVSVS